MARPLASRRTRVLTIGAGAVTCAGAALALAMASGLLLPGHAPAQDVAVTSGVTTHFSQGWPPRLLPVAQQLGVQMIRDSVHWPLVEKTPGRYDFTPANSGHIDRACTAGIKVLLGEEPRNPNYDGGQTAYTPTAQAAYARFVKALADRWPHCVTAVEIGNEINGKPGMTGPAAQNRIAAHVALLRAVSQAVKPAHPDLALLGGSVNTVAGGFIRQLIGAGALQWVDGFALHPYRIDPEGVDQEITRLRGAMRAAGGEKPLWATEFSRVFTRPGEGAGHYLKMAALMEGAGVTHHLWYALADQPGFPTMGLVQFNGAVKPAGEAFRLAARELVPHGAARRVDEGDPTLFHFRYGADAHLIWGAPRGFRAQGPAVRILSATGAPVSAIETGDEPLVILGATTLAFGPRHVLADSLASYGTSALEWSLRRPGAAAVPLRPVEWQWSSYLGNSAIPGAVVNTRGAIIPAGTVLAVGFHPAAATPLFASACLVALPGTTARVSIERNGVALWSETLTGAAPLSVSRPLATVTAADRIDLVVAPSGGAPARLRYRLRMANNSAAPAPCPEERPS
jgi:hypothetical protein